MTKEVAGIPLESMEEPIRHALQLLSGATVDPENYLVEYPNEPQITFDLDGACLLEPTPEKPNSARSLTVVKRLGEPVANIVVIAFAPGDGTGDESAYKLGDVTIDENKYPREAKIIPRKKPTHAEAHFALAASFVGNDTPDFAVGAGHLQELTLDAEGKVVPFGYVGQDRTTFLTHVADHTGYGYPDATLTTGHWGELDGIPSGERFGDPHSIYNSTRNGLPPTVQIAGFIAVDKVNLDLLSVLGAYDPERPLPLRFA